MRNIEQICKKNILVIILIILFCPILAISYSSLVVNTNRYRASEMLIGNLLYSIKIDGASTNTITVSPGETESLVEVTSLNAVSSMYKLIYSTNSSISVEYALDENTPSYGLITTKSTSSLLITNTSSSNITISFNIAGGFVTDDISNIIINSGYTEINNNYYKYDFEMIELFIDGSSVNSLDYTASYNLLSTTNCNNSETVAWDNTTKIISIYPLSNQTKCTLYFETVN